MKKINRISILILLVFLSSNISISNQLYSVVIKKNDNICSSEENPAKHNCYDHCLDFFQDDVEWNSNTKFVSLKKTDNCSKNLNTIAFIFNIPQKSQSPPVLKF